MGKWDKVVAKLPPKPSDDPNRQYQVEQEKAKILESLGTGNIEQLVKLYISLRKQRDFFKTKLEPINLGLEALEQMLDEAFAGANVTSVHTNEGNVNVRREPVVSVVDKDGVRLWAIENGFERELTILWQTLNSVMKERMLTGFDVPECVKMYSRPVVSLREAGKDAFNEDALPVVKTL